MKNYRIAKVTDGEFVRFYPQRKILGLIWIDMFITLSDYCGWFHSYEEAKKNLCHTIRKPVVEYLDVDCEELK
jgi:hypothetical protein